MMKQMQALVVSRSNSLDVKLCKMPLFGNDIPENEIDFTYPSDEEFQYLLAMEKEVKLQSITSKFMTRDHQNMSLFGIQLKFTNGVETPMYCD